MTSTGRWWDEAVKGILTGGPLAGKTSVTDNLGREYPSKKDLVIVPEAATAVLESLYPKIGTDMEFSDVWMLTLQKILYPTQTALEEIYMHSLIEKEGKLLLCDRGVLDGAAYVPGGLPQLEELCEFDGAEKLAGYDLVIHLESVATANPPLWDTLKATNAARYETLDQAIEREMALRSVYESHPNYHFVSGKDGIDSVVAQVHDIVSRILDVRTERVWYIPGPALSVIDLGAHPQKVIRQAYFTPPGGPELRVRAVGVVYTIGMKSNGTLTRTRWERKIPKNIFDELWGNSLNERIVKTRYFIPYGKHTLELDVFPDEYLNGALLSCSFNGEKSAAAFNPPDWATMHGACEVTHAPEYRNRNLARK